MKNRKEELKKIKDKDAVGDGNELTEEGIKLLELEGKFVLDHPKLANNMDDLDSKPELFEIFDKD